MVLIGSQVCLKLLYCRQLTVLFTCKRRSYSQKKLLPEEVTPRSRDDHMDQAIGDEHTRTGNGSGQGGSPSYRVGAPPSNAIMRLVQQQKY